MRSTIKELKRCLHLKSKPSEVTLLNCIKALETLQEINTILDSVESSVECECYESCDVVNEERKIQYAMSKFNEFVKEV